MKEHIKSFEIFLNESTNERYLQWSRKTPIFVSMLQRFTKIKPDEWTEYQKVNHTLLGTLKNWFEIEIED